MLKQHRFLIPAIIAVLILIAAAAGWWLSLPRGDELAASIRMTPSAQDNSGVLPDASFAVTSGFDVGEEELRAMLELDPPFHYTLSGAGKEWTLSPGMPLRENTVYTFRVNSAAGNPVQSFAFQTRTDLLVSDVFPGDRESYVDVNTGIEIRFNRPGVDLSKGFSILPNVSGRFETRDYSCRFIPDRPLEYNSIYRVTLKNLRSEDGADLKAPYTFSFETMEEEGSESWEDLRAGSFAVSFLPDDAPRVALWGGERQTAGTYAMTLHKYPGIKAYEAALREHDAFYREQYGVKEPYRADTDGLDEIMNTEGVLLRENDGCYAPLPADLSEGYYLFTLSGQTGEKEQFVQQLIQVVNLSVYVQAVDGQTLFWLGDPVTGTVAEDARVELETETGKTAGQTDENGLVKLGSGESEWAYATVIRDGTPVWFGGAPTAAQAETPLSRSYYAALYTDREIYLPGDPIQFWGVVKPRAGGTPPETVQVKLGTYWPESSLSRITVDVAADGTFSGILSPGTLQAGSYGLTVAGAGEGAYLSRYLEISQYTKPAYEITLSTDRDFYYYGETVRFSVSAKYYDGTPAAGAKLLAECYEARLEQFPVTLDANGEAAFTGLLDPSVLRTQPGGVMQWGPNTVGWSVRSADEQAVNLFQWDDFTALPSKIAVDAAYTDGGTVSIETAVLDDGKLDEPWKPGVSEFERLRGVPADIPLSLIVHKATYRQIQTGSWYDYVNKQNVPVYETKREETVERTLPVETAAGKATVTGLPVKETDDVSYWFELRFAGGVYGDVCETVYPASPYHFPEDSTYSFLPEDAQAKAVPGRELELGLYLNGGRTENQGAVLYTLVQDGMVAEGVFTGDSISLPVKDEYMPNIWLVGAYFDGKGIHPIDRVNITCDYTEKVLDLQVSTERTEYRPGEEMKVTLTVKDAEGNPVNGRAAVGVVDEAVFALADQTVDLAGQLYGRIYYPNISVNVTEGGYGRDAGGKMRAMSSEGAADEMAPANTGGGGMTRSVFADTASFQVVDITGGTAQAALTLPDNVTSWRVTAAAVTTDLKAGDALTNAAATLPFYLRPIVSDTYLVGDDVTVSALAVGTALKGADGTVAYTAVLTNGSADFAPRTVSVEAAAGARGVMGFGQLAGGVYEVEITAAWNGMSDAMKLPVTVAETGLLVPVLETMPLQELAGVKSAAWPVEATVYDQEHKTAYEALAWLSRQGGLRTEATAAAARAMELYDTQDGPSPRARDPRLENLAGEEGGIIPLPGAGADAALTAKIMMAAPELCHMGQCAEYLRAALKNPAATPEDRIMAYVGLAAAKEPVLLDLQRLYEENTEMEPYLRLYVGAAFARLGNFDLAKTIYGAVKTVRAGDLCHIEDGNIRRATAAALLLATEAGLDDRDGLAKYLLTQKTEPGKEGALCNLELLAYAKNRLAGAGGAGKFSYYADGAPKTVELTNGAARITLGPNDVNNRFRDLSGNLYAAARVLRPGEGAADGAFAEATKRYEPVGGALTPGGQVKVTLRVKFAEDAPYGGYELADYIPSGLRWLGGGNLVSPADAPMWPSISQDGQRITGVIYRTDPEGGVSPLETRVAGASVRMLAGTAEAARPTEPEEIEPGPGDEEPAEPEGAEPGPGDARDTEPGEPEIPAGGEEAPAAEEEPVEDGETDRQAAGNHTPPANYKRLAPAAEDPNEYVIEYYLSAALPGNYVTESAWITHEGGAVKSDRGVLAIAANE